MGAFLKMGSKDQISMQIKDHILRCVVTKQTSVSTIQQFYEKVMPDGTLEKGNIIDQESFEIILEECVSDWNIKRKNIKFLVPDSSVFFRQLTIPGDLAEDEIRGYINFELGSTIHLPFDEAYFDYYLLESDEAAENSEERTILLFAVPEALVNSYVSHFEDCKLSPLAADVAPLSLARLYFQDVNNQSGDHVMLLEWDLTSVNISIFHKHKPVFMRNIQNPFDRNDWELNREDHLVAWECLDEEKVQGQLRDSLVEVERVIDFYKYTVNKGNAGVNTIFLSGDHPFLFSVRKWLEEASEIQVTTENSLQILSKVNVEIPGRFLLPLSLCLKEV